MGNFVPPGSGCLVVPVGAFVVGGSLGDEVEGDDEVGYFVGNAVGYFVPPGRGYLVDVVDGTDVGVVGHAVGDGVGARVVGHSVGFVAGAPGHEVGCFVDGHDVGVMKLGAPVGAFVVGASVVASVGAVVEGAAVGIVVGDTVGIADGATVQTQFPHGVAPLWNAPASVAHQGTPSLLAPVHAVCVEPP